MCGIIGVAGSGNCTDLIIEGLRALEYRGYDSAGLSLVNNGTIFTKKLQGRVQSLADAVQEQPTTAHLGIGHTRWATHGIPSAINSHPIVNSSNTLALVHNGIIENYQEIKDFLLSIGYQFISDTDTEAIVHLIDYYYQKTNSLLFSFFFASKSLEGSYALALIAAGSDQILAVKKDSPLVVGLGQGINFVASDKRAMDRHVKQFIYLKDYQFALISKDQVVITDFLGKRINQEIVYEEGSEAASQGQYPHYMLKEIHQQLDNVRLLAKNYLISEDIICSLKKAHHIYLIGCGTSYYAALIGANLINRLFPHKAEAVIASEFRYSDPFINEDCLVIILSQSGETADTLAALRLAKKKRARSIAILNTLSSSIGREVDYLLPTKTGPEVAVASTKAYTAQVLILILLFSHLSGGTLMGAELKKLPEKVEQVLALSEQIEAISCRYYHYNKVFFIGRQLDYLTSLEGALKLKEIAYIPCQAYPAGELKHGPLALIDEHSLVIALSSNPLVGKLEGNIMEARARGAKILVIADSEQLKKVADELICVPTTNSDLTCILMNIVQQLFAYYFAKLRGLDIDKPRNLAKSVTVE